jgi:glutaminyl-tRNA synthetase
MEEPPKKYFRLRPGGEVRLKYSYIIKCENIIKDHAGNITEIICTYDPDSKPGTGEWRSVKGTIHWVSVKHAVKSELRLFERLFTEADMDSLPEGKSYTDFINPDSLIIKTGFSEPAIIKDKSDTAVQFERNGYFVKDIDSADDKLVYNKTVGLKSNWTQS